MNLNINDIFKTLLPVIIYILLYFLITKEKLYIDL